MKKNEFLAKVHATVMIWRALGLTRTIHLAPDAEARATVVEIMLKTFKPSLPTFQHELVLNSAADEILARIKSPSALTVDKKLRGVLGGFLNQGFWFHSQLAGLTANWELHIRLFVRNLGLRSNVPIGKKVKRHRRNRAVEHLSLVDLVNEMNKITQGRLSLKLLPLIELRNAIVHCNPQAIKAYARPLLGKDVLDHNRGNVVVFGVGRKPILVSNIVEEADFEEEDLFSFFLDLYNSRLPVRAFEEFERSTRQIQLLTAFAAGSFDSRKDVFRKLLIEGKWPRQSEIQDFKVYLGAESSIWSGDPNIFFDELKNCFGKDKVSYPL